MESLGEPPRALRGDIPGDRVGDLPGEVEEPLPGEPSAESCGDRGETERRPRHPPNPVWVKLDCGILMGIWTGHCCSPQST